MRGFNAYSTWQKEESSQTVARVVAKRESIDALSSGPLREKLTGLRQARCNATGVADTQKSGAWYLEFA